MLSFEKTKHSAAGELRLSHCRRQGLRLIKVFLARQIGFCLFAKQKFLLPRPFHKNLVLV
jgi:hypothetical protein